MITGMHVLLYSKDAEADRAFLRDVLRFRAVDAGEGWLIFALPPAELGVHPADGDLPGAELYLMCADLDEAMKTLASRGVRCGGIDQARWGRKTTIPLPGGGQIGLYQPTHPTAVRR